MGMWSVPDRPGGAAAGPPAGGLPPRWTAGTLRAVFSAVGFRPRRTLGQNFLADPNFVRYFVESAGLQGTDRVLEIGPGPAILTGMIADRVSRVLAVEIDAFLFSLCQRALEGRRNVRLLHGDVLLGKSSLSPVVLEAIRDLTESGKVPYRVVSSLPYAIAFPVILNVLEEDVPCCGMHLLVQWEAAERLLAEPGTSEYGPVTVFLQSQASVRMLRRVPPTVFWPSPKVDSAVIEVRPLEDPAKKCPPFVPAFALGATAGRPGEPGSRERTLSWNEFRAFVQELFRMRRKTLGRVLRQILPMLPEEVVTLLGSVGIDPRCRAESLRFEEFVSLAMGIRERGRFFRNLP